MSFFQRVEKLPADKIFKTKQEYAEDTAKPKYNLGIGAYRTKEGKPLVLKVVRKVEQEIAANNKLNKEYFPIGGDKNFVKNAQQLVLGEEYTNILNDNSRSIAGVQSLSGTGALRVLFNFIKVMSEAGNIREPTIWVSNPTWGNHKKIIGKARLKLKTYTYWNPQTRALNFQQMLADLTTAQRGDVVLLHPCAHNPTGVDPTREQWQGILSCLKRNGLIPFFDSAYQGFATGDLSADSYSVRLFAKNNMEMFISQSFSKNLGLYNERIGCASVIVNAGNRTAAINSHLCAVIRPMYSNPPSHGARIVSAVLESDNNYQAWKKEMSGMSSQILQARNQLRYILETKYSNLFAPGTWKHITDQIGMFCFSGLTVDQVSRMKKVHHTYLLDSGRISMAGVAPSDEIEVTYDRGSNKLTLVRGNINNIRSGNVVYLADAIADVCKNVPNTRSKL